MNAPLSIRDLASIGFPVGAPRGALLMLKLFLDDTGTHKEAPVVGVGGLIGTVAQWTEFDAGWKQVLREPCPGKPPLTKWSSFDCRWGRGEFISYNEAERDLTTFNFREIITKTGVFSASNMIDRVAWDETITARFGTRMASAEATALFALIDRLRSWARTHSEGPQMAIYYDAGRMNDGEIQRLVNLFGDAITAIPEIHTFTFSRVAETTPLQGADMIATESFWFAQEFLGGNPNPARAHFQSYLRDNPSRGNGMIMDRDAIEREAARRNPDGTIRVLAPS